MENLLNAPIELDDVEIEAVSGGAFNNSTIASAVNLGTSGNATSGSAGSATASGTNSIARARSGFAVSVGGVAVIAG